MDVNLGPGKDRKDRATRDGYTYIYISIHPSICLYIHQSNYLAILRLSIYLHIMYKGAAAENWGRARPEGSGCTR